MPTNNISKRVYEAMAQDPRPSLSPQDIASILGDVNVRAVDLALQELVRRDLVVADAAHAGNYKLAAAGVAGEPTE